MQAALREKLRKELSTARQVFTLRAEEIRKLEVEKVALEMDKEVLEREKVELQQQVNAMSGQGGGQNAAKWQEIAEFWSDVGAKTMVKNALCAPEMTSWLKRFAGVCADIGYTSGVAAVFKAKLAGQKAEEFPYYEDGNMDEQTFVNRQIALLQAGIVKFEFLKYIEANPGMSSQELVDVFKQVYPGGEKEDEEEETMGVVPPEEVEEMLDTTVDEGTRAGTSGQVAPELAAASGQIEEPEKEAQDESAVQRGEDPGNARED